MHTYTYTCNILQEATYAMAKKEMFRDMEYS